MLLSRGRFAALSRNVNKRQAVSQKNSEQSCERIAENTRYEPRVTDAALLTFRDEGRQACVIGQPFAFGPSSH